MREASPKRVGPYDTVGRLGAGGMGEVFLATPDSASPGHYEPDALVAVKVIRRDIAGDPAFRARFRREISVAASVRSPYVARLVGGDAEAAEPWLATEYVAGPNLAQAVRAHGPLPADAVAALGAGLAEALAAVHAAGALHRDLKPANVLLGAEGPQLIDFGVARALGATTMTSTGLLVGTPGFMSPEHVAGGRHVVAASDVFCLASVLAYAASGGDPFGDGPVAAVLYRVSRAEARLDDVPAELREVLAACLVPEPGDRPAPREVAARLTALRGGTESPGWPSAVVAAIEEIHRDTLRLCAAGRPLLPLPEPPRATAPTPTQTPTQTPTWTPTRAPAASAVHGLPTMGAAPPAAPAPSRSRRRALAVIVAVAVAGGGVGALLALRGSGGGEGGGGSGGSAGPGVAQRPPGVSAAELVATAGVDATGTRDRSGSVPQYEEQRPKGWKPWRARFRHAPMNCAADTKAVVCLLTDGTYEALSASDGHRLWVSDGRSDADRGARQDAFVGPSGSLFVPGDTVEPQVRGGTTVVGYRGGAQLRDSASGRVRWTAKPSPGHVITSVLLTDDRLVVSEEGAPDAATGETPDGARLRAYTRGGRQVWREQLSGDTLAMVEKGHYRAELAHDGLVYAQSKDGVIALDARRGGRVGGAYGKRQCLSLKAVGGKILCAQPLGDTSDLSDPTEDPQTRVVRLDPRTLAPGKAFGFRSPPVGDDGFGGSDLVVSAVGKRAALAYDMTGKRLVVADPGSGEVLRRERIAITPYSIRHPAPSGPLLVGGRALYADNSALLSVPLTAAGETRRAPVPGAPGDREPKKSADGGLVIADTPKHPWLLPLGGVATVVYDQGTVVSLKLPSP
ncbi:protein kinase [Streptomyces sp. NPDC050703]|uniref:serine/threonine-protein kinase n=1 Tax=Streptomyces sp. NPDC050703 TaxID=3157218 RepID=UPI00341963B0